METLKQVLEREPVAARQLNPAINRDLDTICLKCLDKQPERRYESAAACANDLQRFLDHKPILARPVGPTEKLVRWCRRNPAAALVTAAVALLLVSTTVASLLTVHHIQGINTDLIQARDWRKPTRSRRRNSVAPADAQTAETHSN